MHSEMIDTYINVLKSQSLCNHILPNQSFLHRYDEITT